MMGALSLLSCIVFRTKGLLIWDVFHRLYS